MTRLFALMLAGAAAAQTPTQDILEICERLPALHPLLAEQGWQEVDLYGDGITPRASSRTWVRRDPDQRLDWGNRGTWIPRTGRATRRPVAWQCWSRVDRDGFHNPFRAETELLFGPPHSVYLSDCGGDGAVWSFPESRLEIELGPVYPCLQGLLITQYAE